MRPTYEQKMSNLINDFTSSIYIYLRMFKMNNTHGISKSNFKKKVTCDSVRLNHKKHSPITPFKTNFFLMTPFMTY